MAGLSETPHAIDALLVAVASPHPAAAQVASVVGIPPLGLAYLAAVLRRRGLSVRIADLNVAGWSWARLARCLDLDRPRVVGISCMTESYRNAVRLAARIRRRRPEIRIVIGGPHVSFLDAEALRTGQFDVVVRGEGEGTAEELFPLLAAGGSPGPDLLGVSYLDGKRIVRTPDRPLETDLDAFPWPARGLLPLGRYGSPGSILTGRGCPGRCPFCSAAAMSGGRHRVRREEAVVEEIRMLRRAGIRRITFLDDTLTGDRARLDRLLDRLERARLRIAWTCESRLESVDRSLLRRMSRLGCHAVQYGIESGTARSRRRAGKAEVAVEEVVRATHRAGIAPVCTFILGLPWEDEADIRETVALGLRLQRDYLATVGFGVLVCYPGTAFWRRGGSLGLRRRTGDFDSYAMHIPTCDTARLDRATLRRLHFEATLRQILEMPRAACELNQQAAVLAGRLRTQADAGEEGALP